MSADVDALNYPYIRIRNVDWLKRTLLIFPHIVRMTPAWGGPEDAPEVKVFCSLRGRRGPLLRSANLFSRNVIAAQRKLVQQIDSELRADRRQFLGRFGRRGGNDFRKFNPRSMWDDRLDDKTFQLHKSKMNGDLLEELLNSQLAWSPSDPHGEGYVEMDAELGKAVMATLAFACAEDEGLKLVTEFPELYGRVIHQPRPSIFENCLAPENKAQVSGEEIAQLVFYQRCDPELLTPERLQALNIEFEALAAFKCALDDAAKSLPTVMADKATREERVNDLITDIFKKWERDRTNLSSYTRAIFGEGVLSAPEKLIDKVAESALGPSAAGAFVGALDKKAMIGAGVGFAIGVFSHAVKSYQKVRQIERESPFRYLTLLEKSGVGFLISN